MGSFSDAVGGGMEAILAGIRNNSVMVWIPVLGRSCLLADL